MRNVRTRLLILLFLLALPAAGGIFIASPALAAPPGQDDSAPRCGDGSAPDYGFTYDLLQPHWTVGGEDYVSEATLDRVDQVLDRLDGQTIVQTMILFLPAERVGNRVNCAVHFLRYMQLGQPSGPRRDNGFVFLIVVEAEKIDVHYGVGLGLPALTAPELTGLNRLAEATYQSSGSLDQALLDLVDAYDQTVRAKYGPLQTDVPARPTTRPAVTVEPLIDTGDMPNDPLGW
ncbi:MAG: hypothetical protein ACKOC5_11450, partial [Chloroflexota bacterium]